MRRQVCSLRGQLVCGNLVLPDSWWVDSASHREYAEERLRELEPIHTLIREWCGQEAGEEYDQVLALRQEVDRLRNLVQQTAWWLKHNGHPVKACCARSSVESPRRMREPLATSLAALAQKSSD